MNLNYAQVLLYAYPQMRALSDAVSVAVENKARLSYLRPESCMTCACGIADEIFLRIALDEARSAVLSVLKTLDGEEKNLLSYKYFRLQKGNLPACSMRSYFRKQRSLLEKIAARLRADGWTEEKFLEEFSAYPPFMKLLGALERGGGRLFVRRRTPTGARVSRGV